MSIPTPPGFTPILAAQETSEESTKMDRDETSLILRRCLAPRHYTDPNVMRFIVEYLSCRHVKQAANAIGITKRDGDNLLKRPDINEAVRQITEAACMKHGFDPSEVVERVKEIMQTDAVDLQNEDGSFVESLHDVAPEVRRGIKKFRAKNIYELDPNGMRVVVGKLIEVEFWDKMKAVELLGREKDLFKETKRHVHDMSKNMSSTLLESKRLAEAAAAEREVNPVITPLELEAVKKDE